MTQDPKKLPNWLRGKKKAEEPPPSAQEPEQSQSQPPPSAAPSDVPPSSTGDDDSALPPWLRNEPPPPPAKPTTSQLKRLMPPAPQEQAGGLPPWLAGMDENKSYKIGGTELSEEYLKGGDALPDTIDSEMTYDSWMADQIESKREKDIEEEIPDLLSSIVPDDSPAESELKQTGQLPDWFLGLEELDDTDAPDWFKADDSKKEKAGEASGDAVPTWINDMVQSQPEPEPVDEIGSFFDSLGGEAPAEEAEDEPSIDWFRSAEASETEDVPGVPDDDFFTQLVGGKKSTPAPAPEPPTPEARSAPPAPMPPQEIELPDIDVDDDFVEYEEEAPPAVEIPQNELDAFFDNVAAVRSAAPVEDIEDPDLEWIVPNEPPATGELPEIPEPDIVIEEEPAAAPSDDTLNWLSQLENIVSSASRPTAQPEESVPLGTLDNWDVPAETTQTEAEAEADAFEWPDMPYIEPESPATAITETQESDWLSNITPDDTEIVEDVADELPSAPPPPPPSAGRLGGLSSRLAKAQQASQEAPPEPPAPPPPTAAAPSEPEDDDLPYNLFGDGDEQPLYPIEEEPVASGEDAPSFGDEPLIPEEELQTGWLTDNLFNDEESAAPAEASASDEDDDFFSQLQANSDANVLNDNDDNDNAYQQPQSSWGAETQDDALADVDFLSSLGFHEQQPTSTQEPQYGYDGQWDSPPQRGEAETLDDDFLASLGMGDTDQPAAQTEPYDQWGTDDQPQEDTGKLTDDDFFKAMGLDEQPAAASEEDALGQWGSQQSEAELAEPLEDDFLASLGMNDQDQGQVASASQNEQYGQWDTEQSAEPQSLDMPQTGDLYGSFNFEEQPPVASEEDALGQWGTQPEAEPLEDDFLASLGMNDQNQPAAQNEQYGQWGTQAEQAPEPLEDDFLASLGMSDQDQPAAQNEQYGQWEAEQSAEQPQSLDMPQTDDLYGSFNFNDQPPAASEEDALGQWGAQAEQAADDDGMPQDDDLFPSFNFDESPAASEEDALGQWGQEQEAEPAEGDFFASLGGMSEAAQGQAGAEAENVADSEADPMYDTNPLLETIPSTPQEEDLFGKWDAEDEKAQQEDDFFARMGLDDDETPSTPEAETEQFGQWQSEATGGDDFFAQFGVTYEDDQQSAASAVSAASAEPADAEPEPDLFGQWDDQQQTDEALQEDDFFASLNMPEMPEIPEVDNEHPTLPSKAAFEVQDEQPSEDFLASLGFQDDLSASLPTNDLFGEWDEATRTEVEPTDADFYASLSGETTKTSEGAQPAAAPEQDPYSQWDDQNAELPPTEDFFSALGMISGGDNPDEIAVPTDQWDGEAPSEEEFFTNLGMLSEDQPPTQPVPGRQQQTFGDVDSYLASLNVGDAEITPTADDLFNSSDSMDIDALFSEPVMKDRPKVNAPTPEGEQLAGANEDWLNQLQASVGEVSASAIVRQKEDRPVTELSDRLKKLRERAEEIPDEAPTASASQSDSLSEVLPAGGPALAPAPFVGGTTTAVGDVALTSEQQARVELLKGLVPTDTRESTRISAIDATYDSPFMADLEDSEESIVVPAKHEEKAAAPARARVRRQPQRIRIERVLIAALIALAVIVPFTIRGFRVGNLPPSSFAAGSSEQTAFSQINSLKAGDLVLVGVEYGPTSAAELDGMTTALIKHILMKAAYPVIISGDPLAILRTQDLMTSISADSAFLKQIGASQLLAANHDYYIVRYLPGGVIGLRAFSQDTANLILTDVQGQATGLIVRSMQNFALVTVVTDRAEEMRAYAEQIAPLTRAPLVSAVSYSAAPLAEPYIHSMGGGLLIGYRDAYTYADALGSVAARQISQQAERVIPTEIPTQAPQINSNGNGQPGAEATAEATTEAGSAPTTLGTATVISRQAVNMRSGPGTSNPVIAAVPSGSVLSVLGLSDTGDWVHVTLDNGQDGWISAGLLSLNIKQSSFDVQAGSHAKRQPVNPDLPTRTPRPTRAPETATPVPTSATTTGSTEETTAEAGAASTDTVEATSTPTSSSTPTIQPTATATATAVAAVYVPPPPPSPGYRDERWYAMNFGIIASTLVITFGAVVNILRGLVRRGRRG